MWELRLAMFSKRLLTVLVLIVVHSIYIDQHVQG